MITKYFTFLDERPWIYLCLLALGILAMAALESSSFPLAFL